MSKRRIKKLFSNHGAVFVSDGVQMKRLQMERNWKCLHIYHYMKTALNRADLSIYLVYIGNNSNKLVHIPSRSSWNCDELNINISPGYTTFPRFPPSRESIMWAPLPPYYWSKLPPWRRCFRLHIWNGI